MKNLYIRGEELVEPSLRSSLKKTVRLIYKGAGLGDRVLSVAFIDNDEMKELNYLWRGKKKTTDVLSFSAQEGEIMPGTENLLGDLAICVDVALKQAKKYKHSLNEEVAVLVSHGILHLLGYDHERSDEDAHLQAEMEMSLLAKAGFDPQLALTGRQIHP